MNSDDVVRFWGGVGTRRAGLCWLWLRGSRDAQGYGSVSIAGRDYLAHRVSWEIAHGPIAAGLCVLHRCDTPACVNSAHLFLGTRADNNRDRNAKGRQSRGAARSVALPRGDEHWARLRPDDTAKGERHGMAKLTESEVIQIRERCATGEKYKPIAKDFGIHLCTVGEIYRGLKWPHVGGPIKGR